MTTTVHVTIKTRGDGFEPFLEYAKRDLYWTREHESCHSIHCSSDKETNTIKFVEVWDSKEAFMSYFEKRGERSGEKFAQWLEENGISFEFHNTDEWGYGTDYWASSNEAQVREYLGGR